MATPYTKGEAIEVIEDQLAQMSHCLNRGIAQGMIGTFYLVGILDDEERDYFMAQIPKEHA